MAAKHRLRAQELFTWSWGPAGGGVQENNFQSAPGPDYEANENNISIVNTNNKQHIFVIYTAQHRSESTA